MVMRIVVCLLFILITGMVAVPPTRVTKVTVDLPWDLPPAGSKCIADALSKVTVADFGGNPATIGANWVVP